MEKNLRALRQVNIFTNQKERLLKAKPVAKKASLKKVEQKKREMTKSLVRNFFENQRILPVINAVNSAFSNERHLPLLPNEFLENGVYKIVTKHRATRVSDSLDDRLNNNQTRNSTFKNTWSDEHIVVVHSELLYESLTMLTYEGTSVDKLDVIEWIFAEDDLLWHGRKTPAETIPFSFQACCKLGGYDYTILQSAIHSELPSEYKQLVNFKLAA